MMRTAKSFLPLLRPCIISESVTLHGPTQYIDDTSTAQPLHVPTMWSEGTLRKSCMLLDLQSTQAASSLQLLIRDGGAHGSDHITEI